MHGKATEWANLSAFQQDLIVATLRRGGAPDADDADLPHGLAVKNELEVMRRTEVNHGRLYPNLDDLVDDGFVTKGTRDRRTNTYAATEHAVECLSAYLSGFVGVDVDPDDVATAPNQAAHAADRGEDVFA